MDASVNEHKIWTLAELIADRTLRPEAIVEGGILNTKSLLLITGQPKAKKSFLAMNLAVGIAAGHTFACFCIRNARKVLVLSAEGGFYSNKERVIRLCQSVPMFPDENLRLDFGTTWKLDNQTDYSQLRTVIDRLTPDVLVLDPLVKFHAQDENSARDMSSVLNPIRGLIEEKNISVILVHHQGKMIYNGARGSSVIAGEYDAAIQIDKQKDAQTLEFDMRHAETPDPLKVRFNPKTYWFESEENPNPLITILQQFKELDRKAMIQKLVEGKHYATEHSANNKITKDKNKGVVIERNGILSLPESVTMTK